MPSENYLMKYKQVELDGTMVSSQTLEQYNKLKADVKKKRKDLRIEIKHKMDRVDEEQNMINEVDSNEESS
jgi:predicted nucleotidyltransferase